MTLTVDANGNTTAKGADTFSYDQPNRLTSATVAGGTETYSYDGDGVRFSRTVGANPAIRYISDVNTVGGLPATLDDGTRKDVYGLGLAYAVSGTILEIYHTDRLGSIRAITDAAGSVTATYRTDEFGVPTATSGSSSQPFRYTGEPLDATGLVFLRARYYDPTLGRFTTRDRIAGAANASASLNRYTYTSNNPVSMTDPSGLCSDPGGPGIRYCIDRFISDREVCLVPFLYCFSGDNRGTSASGGTYRVEQMIFQELSGRTVSTATAGTSELTGPFASSAVGRVDGCSGEASKALVLSRTRFILAVCAASNGVVPGAPPIRTAVLIEEGPNGAQVVVANGTPYPSMEVWQYGGSGGPRLLFSYFTGAPENEPFTGLFLFGDLLPLGGVWH